MVLGLRGAQAPSPAVARALAGRIGWVNFPRLLDSFGPHLPTSEGGCAPRNHTKLTYRFQGRDFRLTDVAGRLVDKLVA